MREQNELSEDIVNAITSNSLGDTIDESVLEDELDQLQQEQLDEQILKTGNVPVSDAVHKMPTPLNTERTFQHSPSTWHDMVLTNWQPCQARSRPSRRTTKRQSSGSCKQRWPCKHAFAVDHGGKDMATRLGSLGAGGAQRRVTTLLISFVFEIQTSQPASKTGGREGEKEPGMGLNFRLSHAYHHRLFSQLSHWCTSFRRWRLQGSFIRWWVG